MSNLLKALTQVATHALCGRQRVGHLGVLCLQFLKLTHQVVKFLVTDSGLVENIVIVVVTIKHLAQLHNASRLSCGLSIRHGLLLPALYFVDIVKKTTL